MLGLLLHMMGTDIVAYAADTEGRIIYAKVVPRSQVIVPPLHQVVNDCMKQVLINK